MAAYAEGISPTAKFLSFGGGPYFAEASCICQIPDDSNDVVCCKREQKDPSNKCFPSVAHFAQQPIVLGHPKSSWIFVAVSDSPRNPRVWWFWHRWTSCACLYAAPCAEFASRKSDTNALLSYALSAPTVILREVQNSTLRALQCGRSLGVNDQSAPNARIL